ncbi:MAG TPA: hypothetical protein VGY66_25145 [Gemmataceae bacterium]|jgi:hypothetical protein|nr:hypothetical protein [Gemmataceae bacterium]
MPPNLCASFREIDLTDLRQTIDRTNESGRLKAPFHLGEKFAVHDLQPAFCEAIFEGRPAFLDAGRPADGVGVQGSPRGQPRRFDRDAVVYGTQEGGLRSSYALLDTKTWLLIVG